MSYEDPNFTIITSGGCNAFCGFCTDPFKRKASTDYMKNLEDVLFNRLPSHFHQVSISGGEPTLSPDLGNILGMIKLSNRFDKVVLTTNGARLKEKLSVIARGVNHVNVSRHAIGYAANTVVFGTTDIITDVDLREVSAELNQYGIDINLNHVYSDKDKDKITVDYVYRYVDYAKSVGASSINFRYDQNENTMEQTFLEKLFEDWDIVGEGSCPVCRSHAILINGMPVAFKASYAEPSVAIDDVFELVYSITGKLTTDWEGKKEFTKELCAKYEAEYKANPNKKHVPAKMGKTIPKIKPRTKPFVPSLADDIDEVKNDLPVPAAHNRPKIAIIDSTPSGCGSVSSGCGRRRSSNPTYYSGCGSSSGSSC